MADIYFWRQFFILSAGLFSSLAVGLMLTFPSVLNPGITSSNSTDIKTTSDHTSWITAIHGIGGLVGCFIIAPIMEMQGRKACHISVNVFWLIGWTIFLFAKDINALYITRFIQGLSTSGVYILCLIQGEYVHPRRRGYFITLNKVFTAVGVLCCHAMSAFMTWRQIAGFAGVLPIITILMTLFWPESPSYLALKGKFGECKKSFEWLNGKSEQSRKELQALVSAQREKVMRRKTENNSFVELAKKFSKKDFQKSFLISSVLTLSIDVSGRFYYILLIYKRESL